jgi:hypothetical protein
VEPGELLLALPVPGPGVVSEFGWTVMVVTVGRYDLRVIEFPDAADASSYGVSFGGVGVDEPRPYE